MTYKFSILCLSFLLCLSAAHAKMRIWTDKKGNSIEAEYVSMVGQKIVLKKLDGKIMKVPMTGLSQADIDYLANTIPPKIEIKVDVDKDRDTLSSYSSTYGSFNYERKAETTKCSVTVEKKSKEPCNQQLRGRVFLIGKQEKGDLRRVIGYAEHDFSFENNKSTTFKTKPATVKYARGSFVNKQGSRYEGYLVIIENQDGEIIATESSQGSYETNAEKFQEAKKGSRFDRDFDILDSDD